MFFHGKLRAFTILMVYSLRELKQRFYRERPGVGSLERGYSTLKIAQCALRVVRYLGFIGAALQPLRCLIRAYVSCPARAHRQVYDVILIFRISCEYKAKSTRIEKMSSSTSAADQDRVLTSLRREEENSGFAVE